LRIVVLSDTHGDFRGFYRIVNDQAGADLFLFLGDGARELEEIRDLYPDKKILSVKGNCDLGSPDPEEAVCMAGEKKILFTHGHMLGVDRSDERLLDFARASRAQVALYGHTHVARIHYENGVYLMNPGSVSKPREGGPSYGILDITPAGIVPNIVPLGISPQK
jgi:putative phosphoesterase